MRKNILIYFFVLIFNSLLSCTESKKESKTDFRIFSEQPNFVISPDNYSKNSIAYLSFQREHLQTVLPNAILDILEIYKKLLLQVDRNKVYATSAEEQKKYMLEAQSKAFDSLVSKDIDVNLSYLDLLENLENLNRTYSEKYDIPIDSFKSYYEMDKIILSEEVLLKVQRLLKDDKQRTVKLEKQAKNNMIADGTILILNLVPMGGYLATVPAFSKSALTQIHNGVKNAANNKDLIDGSGKIAQISYDFVKKSGTSKFGSFPRKIIVKTLSNEAKRTGISTSLVGGVKRTAVTKSVIATRNSQNSSIDNEKIPKNTKEFFKNIDNELMGRIGDFSEGMITVYLQNIREVIKYNQNVIKYKTTRL